MGKIHKSKDIVWEWTQVNDDKVKITAVKLVQDSHLWDLMKTSIAQRWLSETGLLCDRSVKNCPSLGRQSKLVMLFSSLEY